MDRAWDPCAAVEAGVGDSRESEGREACRLTYKHTSDRTGWRTLANVIFLEDPNISTTQEESCLCSFPTVWARAGLSSSRTTISTLRFCISLSSLMYYTIQWKTQLP